MSDTALIERGQAYVAGFLFSECRNYIALVGKLKPAWQAGKLNAIGGKIEPGETPAAAMAREFREEAGVGIDTWRELAVLRGPDFVVYFFEAFDSRVFSVRTCEEERIFCLAVSGVLRYQSLIPNLRVLIPLALDQSGIAKPVILTDERAAA